MVWVAAEVFGILMRWAHIVSTVLLIGGVAYARMVAPPALFVRYRPVVYASIVGLIVSGSYNYVMHMGHTRYYEMWFGIKILLALHVFAGAFLALRSDDAKSRRRMTGVILSGLAVILVAAYLRRIY
jgi:Co/Zn/Cd efflux system component